MPVEVARVDYERAFDRRSTLQSRPTGQIYHGMHIDCDMSCGGDCADLELPRMVRILDLKPTRIVLQEQSDRAKVGMGADARDLLVRQLFSGHAACRRGM